MIDYLEAMQRVLRFSLLLMGSTALCFQLEPVAIFERLDRPEFSKGLHEILAAVKLGQSPGATDPATGAQLGRPMAFITFAGVTPSHTTVVLPAALMCSMTEFSYSCTWETKANRYSAAILGEHLSVRIAAALPDSWKREKGEGWEMGYGVGYGLRFTDFTDPSGRIVVSVSCPIWLDNARYSSYSATWKIERTELRQMELQKLSAARQ